MKRGFAPLVHLYPLQKLASSLPITYTFFSASRSISDDWPGLPDDLDAAVTWPNNKATYFFKGDQYWKFVNKKPERNYPRSISRGFKVGKTGTNEATLLLSMNNKLFY